MLNRVDGVTLVGIAAFAAGCAKDVEPAPGAYTFEYTAYSGSCGENDIQGTLELSPLTVVDTDEGFAFEYSDDFFEEYFTFPCTSDGTSFTCTGDPISKGLTQAGEDITEASITPAIEGIIAEDGTFSGSISGTLSCVGDPMQCEEFGSGWGLEMPCDMVSTFTATPGEG